MRLLARQLFNTLYTKFKWSVKTCNFKLLFVVVLVLAVTFYWKVIDTRVPAWDAANHLLHGYDITSLILSGNDPLFVVSHLLRSSYYYPPFFYFVQSTFHLILGTGTPFVDDIPCLLFLTLAMLSLYNLGKMLLNKEAALLGTFIFCCYPAIMKSVHPKALLDLPLTAMVFLGFLIMLKWKENPTWLKTVLLGIAIGFTGLTKQYGLMFYVPAMLYYFFQSLREKDWKLTGKITLSAVLAMSIFFSWLAPNFETMMEFMKKNHRSAQEESFLQMWFTNVKDLISKSPNGMSWLGIIIYLASFIKLEWHKSITILISGCLFCIAAICSLNWDPYQFRYILPLLGYTALTSGALCASLWQMRSSLVRRCLAACILAYFLFIFIYLSFSPYPIPSIIAVDNWLKLSHLKFISRYTEPLSPLPYSDWGYEWMFEKVRSSPKAETVISVLPDTSDFNTLGLNYLALSRGKPVRFSTIRKWTTRGYNFKYDRKDLEKSDYFLTIDKQKKEDGAVFTEEESSQNYERLKTILKNEYKLVGERTLPNGAILQLYGKP